MTKNRSYVALLADAARSRSLAAARRAALQRGLRLAVPDLNRRFRPVVAAGFALTRGDELEVLLTAAAPVWDIVHALAASFPDVDWAFGCGHGPITTALAPTAPEVDGPSFHGARAALAQAKTGRAVLAFRGFARDAELNACAAYYSALYWTWTEKQRQLARTERAPGKPLAGATVTPRTEPRVSSAVSHMRRRMAWPLVVHGDRIFRSLLSLPETP